MARIFSVLNVKLDSFQSCLELYSAPQNPCFQTRNSGLVFFSSARFLTHCLRRWPFWPGLASTHVLSCWMSSGVIGSPAVGFETLTRLVNTFMEHPPFSYTNLLRQFGENMNVSTPAREWMLVFVLGMFIDETWKLRAALFDRLFRRLEKPFFMV